MMKTAFRFLDVVSNCQELTAVAATARAAVQTSMAQMPLTDRVLVRVGVLIEDPELRKRQLRAMLKLRQDAGAQGQEVTLVMVRLCENAFEVAHALSPVKLDPDELEGVRKGLKEAQKSAPEVLALQTHVLREELHRLENLG